MLKHYVMFLVVAGMAILFGFLLISLPYGTIRQLIPENITSQLEVRATEDPLIAAQKTIERYSKVSVFSVEKPRDYVVIAYDLKPKFLVPNELIHHDSMMEMICALRRQGPIKHPHSFVGMGRFRDNYGRLVYRRSVVSTIAPPTMNLIGCDKGRSATDIDWRKISTFYRSYPVPDGLQVDV